MSYFGVANKQVMGGVFGRLGCRGAEKRHPEEVNHRERENRVRKEGPTGEDMPSPAAQLSLRWS